MRAVDFFCGAGGMTEGMRLAGIEVIAGIDFDIDCKGTYLLNHPQSTFVHADIRSLSYRRLVKETGIRQNDDELVFIGCSPCQYWSKMNTIRTKSRDSRNLIDDFRRFVNHFRPGHVVIENVPGILNNENESPLPSFLKFLDRRGYRYKFRTVNANQFGVPQNRHRFVLIASRVTEAVQFPAPSRRHRPVVRDFIGKGKFPPIPCGHTDPTPRMHTSAGLSATNVRRLSLIEMPGGDRLAWKDDPELQLEAYVGDDHSFSDVYGRMWWDRPAPTITTKFHSISNGRFGHPEQIRAISLREGACLQTFRKSYRFVGRGKGGVAKQIGNAVPPELARRIAQAVLKNRAHE